MPVKCIAANILHMNRNKTNKPHARTNTGKQMISFKAIDLRKSIPQYLEVLNVNTFFTCQTLLIARAILKITGLFELNITFVLLTKFPSFQKLVLLNFVVF